MRKVLLPTDFSENSMNSIKYAINLFKYDICEFYFMHAFQDDIYQDEILLTQETLDAVIAINHKKSEQQLNRIVKTATEISHNPRHSQHIIASNNLLVDEANRIVDDLNIDIVIMGTKGKTNDKSLTFGSHTLQVLKYVQCPVLAIPENHEYHPPKHILFPTNYMIPYKRRELKLLCQMAFPYRAVIDVIYISKSNKLSMRQEDNKAFIKEELRKNNINFTIEKSRHIINAIYKNIKENRTDMLVMVNTRHSFLENILFQSTIDELSLNLDIPFLALQNMSRQ